MAKKPEREEQYIDKLEKEIRTLKSINRQLTKKLRRLDKGFKRAQERDDLEEFEEVVEKVTKAHNCPRCGVGNLTSTNLGPRILTRCDGCEYRESKKT